MFGNISGVGLGATPGDLGVERLLLIKNRWLTSQLRTQVVLWRNRRLIVRKRRRELAVITGQHVVGDDS